MSGPIHAQRVNHINLVVEDIDATIAQFRKLYDAEFLLDVPKPELRAGLVAFGDVIFDLFQPNEFLLCARYGAHYLGLEYQADMAEVREVLASRGMRVARDIGGALHTDPRDGFGIAFEFYDGTFHDLSYALLGDRPMKPPSYWRDEHPLAMTGLAGYTVAVDNLDIACEFMQSFLGAEPAYEASRPAIAAAAIGLRIADCWVELLRPEQDGELQEYLDRYGQGMFSTVIGVRDLDCARRYFADRDIRTIEGRTPHGIRIAAEINTGGILEFEQSA